MVDFHRYHPIVNLIYFVNFILIIMFSESLLCQVICFTLIKIMIFLYKIDLDMLKSLVFDLMFISGVAVVNLLFNHQGSTIILYFNSGNPLTLESIMYGIYSGLMFVSTLNLCKLLNNILNSEKILYLFGKISHKLALIISMSLKYFANFKRKLSDIIESRKNLVLEHNFIDRVKNGLKCISILLSWTFESAIDTSNTMKSRGYIGKISTKYTRFKILSRDIQLLFFMFVTLLLNWYVYLNFSVKDAFFPAFNFIKIDFSVFLYAFSMVVFISIPLFLIFWEKFKWKQ